RRRRERDEQERELGREVGEHHRVEETDALGEPARGEERQPRQDPDPEEDPGERRGIESPAQVEPVRDDRLDDEATGERVEPEERRELRDGPGGAVDTEEAALPLDVRELDPVRKRKEDREVGEADERVQDEKRAMRIGARETVRREES